MVRSCLILLAFLALAPAARAQSPAVLDAGHVDVAPRLVGDELEIQFKTNANGGETWIDADDAVLYIGPSGRLRVPAEGSGGRTWDYIAPQGATVWWMPDSPRPTVPWAGFNVGPIDLLARELSLVLEGVSGPGDVILAEDDLPFFSTKSGLPAIRPLAGHFHMSWFFTQPGVYCLTLAATGRQTTGAQLAARDQITVVTEPTDPATVTPCGRGGPPALAIAPGVAEAAVGGAPVVAAAGTFELRPTLRGEQLDVALVQRSGRDPGIVRRPEDVVFYQRADTSQAPSAAWQRPGGGEVWQVGRGGGPAINWSTLGVADGDLTWRLASLTGPGGFSLDDRVTRSVEQRPIFSTSAGFARSEYILWPRSASVGTWSFTRPGVYCVGLEFARTTASGAEVARTVMLTLAVDEPARRYRDGAYEAVAPTIDPATVTPCARAGQPGGRRIVARGHVDLATRVLDGALELSLRDDTAQPPLHRALDGVVLAVDRRAARAVPDDPALAFLGAPGSAIWVLPQVEDPDLPWPGWNTETLTPRQLAGPVRLTLRAMRGPGEFTLWTTEAFGAPRVLLASRDGLPDALEVAHGTHAHGNWGFSAPGVYCLDFGVTATSASGRPLARDATLLVAVDVDPAAARPEDCRSPDRPPPPAEPGGAPGSATEPPPVAGAGPRARSLRPRLTVRLRSRRVRAGARAAVTVAATLAGRPVAGRVTVKKRARRLASASLRGRPVRLRLPRLAPGRHRLTFRFRAGSGATATPRAVVLVVRG